MYFTGCPPTITDGDFVTNHSERRVMRPLARSRQK
jgi:hypothetical protein